MNTPLLLVPGLLCSHRLFAPQIAAFGAGREVTVTEHALDDTIEAMAERILAAAPDRFAVAGLSMGGYVALEIVRRAPGRVERLALLDTNARADTTEHIAARRKLVALCREEGVAAVQTALLPRLLHTSRLEDRSLVDEVVRMAEEVGEAGFHNQMNAIMTRRERRADLPAIRCPVSIVVGEEDVITPPEMAKEMAELIEGAALHILAGCGHLTTMEKPVEVSSLLETWLDG